MIKYMKFICSTALLAALLLLIACRESLLHNLSEVEANTIIMHLHSAGIVADREYQPDGKWSVAVRQADRMEAMSALSAKHLLRKTPPVRSVSSSMLSSREEQKLHFERTVSTEIEYTLTSLPGVLDARVHLNLPERDPLLGELTARKNNATASVLLVLETDAEIVTSDIQRLLSGAAGIPVNNVAILTSIARGSMLDSTEVVPVQKKTENSILSRYFGLAGVRQIFISILILGIAGMYAVLLIRKYRTAHKVAAVEAALKQSATLFETRADGK